MYKTLSSFTTGMTAAAISLVKPGGEAGDV